MSREAFADRAYAEYADAAGVMKRVIKDRRITPDEERDAVAAMGVAVRLLPVWLVVVTTFRAIGHLSRVGVLAFPGARMAREINELRQLGEDNITSIRRYQDRRDTSGPRGAA